MFITPWKEEVTGTYWECFASLREGLSHIFKLRAVKCSNGLYMAVVRDFGSGKMLASTRTDPRASYTAEYAKRKVLELAQLVLMFEGSEECIQIKHFVCPHESISGKHCSQCKIPDLIPKKLMVNTHVE